MLLWEEEALSKGVMDEKHTTAGFVFRRCSESRIQVPAFQCLV